MGEIFSHNLESSESQAKKLSIEKIDILTKIAEINEETGHPTTERLIFKEGSEREKTILKRFPKDSLGKKSIEISQILGDKIANNPNQLLN